MLNIRNLKITDMEIDNHDDILDGINELKILIRDNYDSIKDTELGIEFNIGSRLGEPKEYLVVYNNPSYKNNPYIFILKQDEDRHRTLNTETTIESFRDLSDLETRRDVNKTLVTGFKMLPKNAFLSMSQIHNARRFAREYDENSEK